jgi:hypothetical protein
MITQILTGFTAHFNIILLSVPGFNECNLPYTARLARELSEFYVIALDSMTLIIMDLLL